MAEEKPEGEFSGSDQGSEVSSAMTPDVSQDSIEDEEPIPKVPNSGFRRRGGRRCPRAGSRTGLYATPL